MSISWPKDETGKVSTTKTGKKCWIAALQPMASSSDTSEDQVSLKSRAKALIHKIESMPNKNWRSEYSDVVFEIADLMASTEDQEVCVEMCRNGLKALRENMVIESSGCLISTKKIEGTATSQEPVQFQLGAPRGVNGEPPKSKFLLGNEMQEQLSLWSSFGCIEKDAADHACSIARLNDATSLVKGKIFVLLGATSELGPFKDLASLGATIACVARPGNKLKTLIADAQKTSCTLLLPVRNSKDISEIESGDIEAGADLISDAPELAD